MYKAIVCVLAISVCFTSCITWKHFDKERRFHYAKNAKTYTYPCLGRFESNPNTGHYYDIVSLPFPEPVTKKYNINEITLIEPMAWIGMLQHRCNCGFTGYYNDESLGDYVINDSFLLKRDLVTDYLKDKTHSILWDIRKRQPGMTEKQVIDFIDSIDFTQKAYIAAYPPKGFTRLYRNDTVNAINFNHCVNKSLNTFYEKKLDSLKKNYTAIRKLDSLEKERVYNNLDQFELDSFKTSFARYPGLNALIQSVPTRYAVLPVVYQIKGLVASKSSCPSYVETFTKYYVLDKETGTIGGFGYLFMRNKYVLPVYPVISGDKNIEEIPVKVLERMFDKLFDGCFY